MILLLQTTFCRRISLQFTKRFSLKTFCPVLINNDLYGISTGYNDRYVLANDLQILLKFLHPDLGA